MQTASQQLQASRYLAYLEAMIGAAGLVLETSHDFRAYQATRDAVAASDGNHLPYRRIFQPGFDDIMPSQGFWVCGRDHAGEVAHLQAMRLDDLRGVTLEEWWQQHFSRLFCRGASLRWTATAPIARTITGTVCYHGEVWVAQPHRHKRIGGKLGQFALALALLTWSPDYVYGLIEPRLVLRGFGVTEGYMHQQPAAITWGSVPAGVNADDWIGWMTRQDLIWLTQQLPSQTARRPPES